MGESSVVINFSKESNISVPGISFSLQSEDNYGKTSFLVEDVARVRFINTGDHLIQFTLTKGAITLVSPFLIEEKTEYVTFINKAETNLAEIPESILSYSWIGSPAPSVVFLGSTCRIPEEGIHVLKVTYTYAYSLYSVSSGALAGPTLVVATDDKNQTTSIEVPFESLESLEKNYHVFINVKDFCSDVVVPNAAVSIAGAVNVSGNANIDGVFDAGILPSGTYTITITATGYIPNSEDALFNDSFSIPYGENT